MSNISALKTYDYFDAKLRTLTSGTGRTVIGALSDDIHCSEGFMHPYTDSNIYIGLGTGNIISPYRHKNYLKSSVSDLDFVKMIVAFHHEKQHLQQYDSAHHMTDEVTYKFVIEEIAHLQNPDYYYSTYSNNICEIDAERHGISNAFNDLKDMLGSDKSEELLLEYIKYRQSKDSKYFISKSCSSLDEIVAMFDDNLQSELQNKSFFRYARNQGKRDLFFNKFILNDDLRNKVDYNHMSDGWKQRELMASVGMSYGNYKSFVDENYIIRLKDFSEFDTARKTKRPLPLDGKFLNDNSADDKDYGAEL